MVYPLDVLLIYSTFLNKKNTFRSFKLSQFSRFGVFFFVIVVATLQKYLSLFIIPRTFPLSSFLKVTGPTLI